MSIQDRIAVALLSKHADIIGDISRHMNSVTFYGSNKITILGEIVSGQGFSIGLQKYTSIPTHFGMVFPFGSPRVASFHMGTVSFPIDIIFISNNTIAKIAENIQPGTKGTWGASNVTDVVETVGGFCRANSIKAGDSVEFGGINKLAQENPQQNYPGNHSYVPESVSGSDPNDRYVGRGTPDEMNKDRPVGQADPENWDSTSGQDPSSYDNDDVIAPTRPF